MLILSGVAARDELKKALVAKIQALQRPLTLAIIQVGMRADSTAYINAKKRFARDIGVAVKFVSFAEDVAQDVIVLEIQKLNQDKEITGIIVQLPLPSALDKHAVLDAINPAKDTDAISSANVKKWSVQGAALKIQDAILYSATARGIGELLDFYKIPIAGKKVCVIGRSEFVGTPIAAMCRARGAIVTVCHSKTADLVKETRVAAVIISAVGKPGLITAAHVKPGQVVVDVGINEVGGKKLDEEIPKRILVGDVDFAAVKDIVAAISPVPSGVGPMTVLALFENLLDCARM